MIKIENLIVWILFILAVIVSLWYIFGISMAFLFTLGLKVGSHEAKLNLLGED